MLQSPQVLKIIFLCLSWKAPHAQLLFYIQIDVFSYYKQSANNNTQQHTVYKFEME